MAEKYPHEIIEMICDYCHSYDVPQFLSAVSLEDEKILERYTQNYLKKKSEFREKMLTEEIEKDRKEFAEKCEKRFGKKIKPLYAKDLLNDYKVTDGECRGFSYAPF